MDASGPRRSKRLRRLTCAHPAASQGSVEQDILAGEEEVSHTPAAMALKAKLSQLEAEAAALREQLQVASGEAALAAAAQVERDQALEAAAHAEKDATALEVALAAALSRAEEAEAKAAAAEVARREAEAHAACLQQQMAEQAAAHAQLLDDLPDLEAELDALEGHPSTVPAAGSSGSPATATMVDRWVQCTEGSSSSGASQQVAEEAAGEDAGSDAEGEAAAAPEMGAAPDEALDNQAAAIVPIEAGVELLEDEVQLQHAAPAAPDLPAAHDLPAAPAMPAAPPAPPPLNEAVDVDGGDVHMDDGLQINFAAQLAAEDPGAAEQQGEALALQQWLIGVALEVLAANGHFGHIDQGVAPVVENVPGPGQAAGAGGAVDVGGEELVLAVWPVPDILADMHHDADPDVPGAEVALDDGLMAFD